jgi:hypothetical protein
MVTGDLNTSDNMHFAHNFFQRLRTIHEHATLGTWGMFANSSKLYIMDLSCTDDHCDNSYFILFFIRPIR